MSDEELIRLAKEWVSTNLRSTSPPLVGGSHIILTELIRRYEKVITANCEAGTEGILVTKADMDFKRAIDENRYRYIGVTLNSGQRFWREILGFVPISKIAFGSFKDQCYGCGSTHVKKELKDMPNDTAAVTMECLDCNHYSYAIVAIPSMRVYRSYIGVSNIKAAFSGIEQMYL